MNHPPPAPSKLRRQTGPAFETIDDSYSFIKDEAPPDHELTISFPIHPKTTSQVPKLRTEVIANEELLADLRKQIDVENSQSTVLRQMLLTLNSFVQANDQNVSQIRRHCKEEAQVPQMITQLHHEYHSILSEHAKEILKSATESPHVQKLTNKIMLLQHDIECERKPRQSPRNEEIERIRGKSRFYKRECDQLDEFLRKEIEFERAEDELLISGLEKTLETISKEIAASEKELALKREQNRELSLSVLFQRTEKLNSRLDELDMEHSSLQGEGSQTSMAIELQRETNQRLEEQLSALQSIFGG
jgi:hypothetical protein